ncbi:MAG: NAD-binding protein, partial [Paracoccaceae bacterium]
AVGMALDLSVIAANWWVVLASVVGLMILKSVVIYAIARAFKAPHREALERMVLMAQGGEFAFVLYAAATAVGIFDAEANAVLTAIIIVSMAITPLIIMLFDRLGPVGIVSEDGMERPDGNRASVLVIGFGRFGQIVSQTMLARRCSITVIDADPEMIRAAEQFGFKIYYGDGARLDILKAAGAAEARQVIICTDKREVTTRIATLLRAEFPDAVILARSYDRAHALELVKLGVDHLVRETFESALALSREALEIMEVGLEEAEDVIEGVRKRDRERFALQLSGDIYSGASLLIGNAKDQAEGR